MEKKTFKYIEVDYKLYVEEDGKKELYEETNEGQPFVFISGFGITIPGFEKQLSVLESGAEFDINIEKNDAYGEYYDERVIDLDKSVFTVNGHFDSQNIYVDAIVPLQNAEGQRFMGQVVEIADNSVKIDLNHPLAGKDLNFTGKVITSREATNEEIQSLVNQLSGGGCGGCGGGCHGGCGGDGNCEGGCGGDCGGDCKCNS